MVDAGIIAAALALTEDSGLARNASRSSRACPLDCMGRAIACGKPIHAHPTLGESIGMAAEVAHGSCTDVPPVRK